MLVGIAENQELIILHQMKNEQIKQLRTRQIHCPGCKAKVILKNGTQKIAHFAHQREGDCQQFSEGETLEHLLGKKLLFEWFKDLGYQPIMEAYLSNLSQRPDLLYEVDGKKVAIEFQCSGMSTERMIERTEQYQKNGYEVIWILGENYFPKQKLSAYQRLFLYEKSEIGFYLWGLDVKREKLLLYSRFTVSVEDYSMISFQKNEYKLSCENDFDAILTRNKMHVFDAEKFNKKNIQKGLEYIERQLYYKGITYMTYQLVLYGKKKHLLLLPLESHLIGRFGLCLQSLPIYVNDCILSNLETYGQLPRDIEKWRTENHIFLYQMPLIKRPLLKDYLAEYIAK